MGICKLGAYTDNKVVTHSPLFCFGGFGQLPCEFLAECMKEHTAKFKKTSVVKEVK